MRVYVAGSWNAREYVRQVTAYLRSQGIDCTNGWMEREGETPEELRRCANEDLHEISAADLLVLLNDTVSSNGGMHFEAGYAYAKDKRVVVIGRRTGVFHYLQGVGFFQTPQEFIKSIPKWQLGSKESARSL